MAPTRATSKKTLAGVSSTAASDPEQGALPAASPNGEQARPQEAVTVERFDQLCKQVATLTELIISTAVRPPAKPLVQTPVPPRYSPPLEASTSRHPALFARTPAVEQSAETPVPAGIPVSRLGNPPEAVSEQPSRPGDRESELKKFVQEMDEKIAAITKLRSEDPMDDLHRSTEPPFTKEILSVPLPKGFKMPQLEYYDGSSDPVDHLESFKALMLLYGVPDAIMCRALPATLKKAARIWYSQLKPGSISSFKELSTRFITHFVSSKRHCKTAAALMNLKQGKEEPLREYVARFNQEALEIRDLDPAVALAAITNGAKPSKFSYSLLLEPPKSFVELLKRAEQYINAEECMSARRTGAGEDSKKRKNTEEWRSKGEHPDNNRTSNRCRTEDRIPPPMFERYTPLNTPRVNILMEVADRHNLRWPGKMHTPAGRRDQTKYCRFHHDHGHDTEGCRALKDEIERLIQRGHLARFIADQRRSPEGPPRELVPALREPETPRDRQIDHRSRAGIIR